MTPAALSAIAELRAAVAAGTDPGPAIVGLTMTIGPRLISPARWAAAFRYAARLLRAAGRPICFDADHTTIAGWTDPA